MLHIRISKNPYSDYRESKESFKKLKKALEKFGRQKALGEYNAIDVVTHEEIMLRELQRDMESIKNQLNLIRQIAFRHVSKDRKNSELSDGSIVMQVKRKTSSILEYL
jgi:hypothetical protein